MFADGVIESSSTTGTGSYTLTGAVFSGLTFAQGNPAGGAQGFFAQTADKSKWEFGYGVLTVGPPRTLTRAVILKSSNAGSAIDWQSTDTYYVFSIASADVVAGLMAGNLVGAGAKPWWVLKGGSWIDYVSDITAFWIDKIFLGGSTHAERGRYYISDAIFAASQRALFVDKGAAGYAFTAADIGKVLAFDCAAAPRTLTMLAHDADGMGHGAYVYVYPYGSATNGVTFTPGGTDTTDLATAPAKRLTKFQWDGARAKWVADYRTPAAALYPAGTITGLTYQNNVSDATNDIDIAAGGCMDATGALWMVMAACTKRLDAAWAVGTNQGGLDTGSIGDSDYYIWAIARSDTGVTDFLFSLSATAPTMPASYDFKRLVGWFKRVSGAIVAFHTYESNGGSLDFAWDAPTLDVNQSNALTTSRRTDAVKVPLNFAVIADLNIRCTDVTNTYNVWVCCPDQVDAAPSATVAPLASGASEGGTAGAVAAWNQKVRTSAAGLIAARADLATLDFYGVSTLGFHWARR